MHRIFSYLVAESGKCRLEKRLFVTRNDSEITLLLNCAMKKGPSQSNRARKATPHK